ncbi:MAG TPA: hypothetical protein VFM55_05110 [Micromonosporaceae bacterium]|nr:hypothetical protein [Micromonosporaceae bacterium]
MTTVTTWTGWEANALRKALRMSVTDFAEHLGAARRTVAKWSSRGRDVQLRTEMQAALDTVLARASGEVHERFEQLRGAGTGGALMALSDARAVLGIESAVDTGGGGQSGLGQDGAVQRRELLTNVTVGGVAAVPAVTRLLDALLSADRRAVNAAVLPSVQRLGAAVAAAKGDYQACRYESVLDRLGTLLPAFVAARSQVAGDERFQLEVLAADLYHVVGSVLLKFGDHAMALVAAERSTRCGLDSGDSVAVGASARIMTHALMSNGHTRRALDLAQAGAAALERATRLGSADSVAVYGALLLRGAMAAARSEDRDAAGAMLDEAERAGARLGHDGNDRWTGFGPNNVLQHRVHIALALGDAGTAVAFARQVQLDKFALAERKASLFVDVARAYTQWGRHEQGLSALRAAYRIAPEEVRSRPAVRRVVGDLAALSRGHVRAHVADFATTVGVRL